MVNGTPWHAIRVRNYEADIESTLVPLAAVLDPIGVKHIVANVTDIDVLQRTVGCTVDGASNVLGYDRLVFALGSRLVMPAIPGFEAHAFNVDTFESAKRLNEHIASLSSLPAAVLAYLRRREREIPGRGRIERRPCKANAQVRQHREEGADHLRFQVREAGRRIGSVKNQRPRYQLGVKK